MSHFVTFKEFQPPGQPTQLGVYTVSFTPPHGLVDTVDHPVSWETAREATKHLADCVKAALGSRDPFPEVAAAQMWSALGWDNGLEQLLHNCAQDPKTPIKFTVSYRTSRLLPEMTPLPDAFRPDASACWLDALGPIYRTTEVEGRLSAEHKEKTLAILYQDGLVSNDLGHPQVRFADIAERLHRKLHGVLIVDAYSGAEFDDARRFGLMVKVFTEYKAVLFLGHSGRDQRGAGWKLADGNVLSMSELREFFGVGRPRGGRASARSLHEAIRAPELVFANCCFDAGFDTGTASLPELSYPKLFLDAGVRYFIGTSMEVVGNWRAGSLDRIELMIERFFRHWAANPDDAVAGLYEAKYGPHHGQAFPGQQYDFLMALYQIHTTGVVQRSMTPPQPEPEVAPAVAVAAMPPTGALVSTLRLDDMVGPYRIVSRLWDHSSAHTFWTERADTGAPCLVQAPVDEWQLKEGIGAELDSAVNRLRKLAAGMDGLLIPDRHESVVWRREERPPCPLHVLVYDRPAGDRAERWSALSGHPWNPHRPRHFTDVLDLGAEISLILAGMHERKLRHGSLDTESVVFWTDPSGRRVAMIKDAWVRQTEAGRCTQPRYAAPEEFTGDDPREAFAHDCWGLGVVLYELATGRPPFADGETTEAGLRRSIRDVMGPEATHVPDALDRVVRECLTPSPQVRPSAQTVARRLLLARHAGGTYLGDFEDALDVYILSGHRLFSVLVENLDQIEQALVALTARTTPAQAAGGQTGRLYRLYVMAEGVGLADRGVSPPRTVVPWMDAATVHAALRQAAAQAGASTPPPPTPAKVTAINAGQLLGCLAAIRPAQANEIPVVLIRGNRWWDADPAGRRALINCQSEAASGPVVVVADSFLTIAPDLARHFTPLVFPPPTPAALFERILDFPASDARGVGVTPDQAIAIAHGAYPCAYDELRQSLRMCAIRHSAVDERALHLLDEEREAVFHGSWAATYIPRRRLPDLKLVGLPEDVERQVAAWARAFTGGGDTARSAPRRLLICGDVGCGKSLLARALAARIERPVLRVDAAACLRGRLGESEAMLRNVLSSANALHDAVVLMEDVDRNFGDSFLAAAANGDGVMTRMYGVLLNWLDGIPDGLVVVMTALDRARLPGQWRRRIQMTLELPLPCHPLDEFRAAVFRAVFRGHGLEALARDGDLMRRLAVATDPRLRRTALPAPYARRADALSRWRVELNTAADIHGWVCQTIDLAGSTPFDAGDFWLAAVSET